MRVLLDSQVLLWAAYMPERLPPTVREMVEDGEQELVASHASVWELLEKIGRGKLLLAGSSVELAQQRLLEIADHLLPVELSHIVVAAQLPQHHHDPFDRVIIAQALSEDLPIVTSDRVFPLYGVDVIW